MNAHASPLGVASAAMCLGIVSFVCFGLGCSEGETPSPTATADAATPTEDAPVEDTAPAAKPMRTLVTNTLYPTSVENLLIDPLVHPNSGFGNAALYAEATFARLTAKRATLAVTPASVATHVQWLADTAAPEETPRRLAFVVWFVGGTGPFRASLWISPTGAAGEPVPLSPDPRTAHGSILLLGFHADDIRAIDLRIDRRELVDGRTWLHLGAELDAIPGAGAFFVSLGAEARGWYVAAPEVVVVRGASTTSAPITGTAAAGPSMPRALTPIERRVTTAYRETVLDRPLPIVRPLGGVP
jgi:hypothetical protein